MTLLELFLPQLEEIAQDFESAARRAADVDFKTLEIHAGHGYLLNQFLSLSADCLDNNWSGDSEQRMTFPLEVIGRVRAVWPGHLPLWVRLSESTTLREDVQRQTLWH